MKKFLILLAGVLLSITLLSILVINNPSGQEFLLKRFATIAMEKSAPPIGDNELRVFVCGSSSPLPDPERAQACVAVLTSDHFFIIDAGAGSVINLMMSRLPFERLEGILVTHFHSDHIAAIPGINLNSWVAGRPQPLDVYGPVGISQVVQGLNIAYGQDRDYRVRHHGAELLPPALGVLKARPIKSEIVVADESFKITAFTANHDPVSPAISYRIDYKGRSVVVTGDTVVTDELKTQSGNLDLLLSDALSRPVIRILEETARQTQRPRNSKILHDIQDYHAGVSEVAALGKEANVRLTVLYHLVPPPANLLIEKIFQRDLPENVILSEDRMWLTLKAGESDIDVLWP